MANLQSYIEDENPSDNPETTVDNDNHESKELEDVNLIVSHFAIKMAY